MNGNYYQSPNFPADETECVEPIRITDPTPKNYLEDILQRNIGKVIRVFATYPDSNERRDVIFFGIIEGAGQGHLVLKDPKEDKTYIILMFYLNYIEFQEKMN